jgi:rhodanese-related sulfurtransferase
MPGIAALGAVLGWLEGLDPAAHAARLRGVRDQLAAALRDAFPGVVFNAPQDVCLPTTMNISVPGLEAAVLLDRFDAAGIRASGGSACASRGGEGSFVLRAMGLPAWQAGAAVRLSFGPLADDAFVEQACARIRECGAALRTGGWTAGESVEMTLPDCAVLLEQHPEALLVDVRDPDEQDVPAWTLPAAAPERHRCVPLARLADRLPDWLARSDAPPVVFYCRSGKRSEQAARLLRRQGHPQAWSLQGGVSDRAVSAASPARGRGPG